MEGAMPRWLVPVLLWGGLALAVVSGAALIYVLRVIEPGAEAEGTAAEITAPVTLYGILLVAGIVAAIGGFVLGRRTPEGGAGT
jgi:hypothetical protein